jgi:hypothetical protein
MAFSLGEYVPSSNPFHTGYILKEKNSGNFGKYKYITIMMNKKKCPNDATKLSTSDSWTRDAQYFSNPKHETT